MSQNLWIGLVDFAVDGPGHPFGDGIVGGSTNAVVFADSPAEFLRIIQEWAATADLVLSYHENIEPLSRRLEHRILGDDIMQAARSVSASHPLEFAAFHFYYSDSMED